MPWRCAEAVQRVGQGGAICVVAVVVATPPEGGRWIAFTRYKERSVKGGPHALGINGVASCEGTRRRGRATRDNSVGKLCVLVVFCPVVESKQV